MSYQVVLISCTIRGRLGSRQRRADIARVRALIEALRREHRDTVFVAPYLLYAECCHNLIAPRSEGLGYPEGIDEVWVYGSALCTAVRCDSLQVLQRGGTVVFKSPALKKFGNFAYHTPRSVAA